jgi:hypothetical protein
MLAHSHMVMLLLQELVDLSLQGTMNGAEMAPEE